ncbi:MAG: hypothetical protein Q8R61_12525 [Thiobacillus sp.]|uniref:hypothetical protein n=1 Tax=Thiobacillus sp. TaxID=924 RepID=UPI002735B04A|nr:hypothetical protein [Thiobacillus sp.]MDP3585947.1 hypothetical protein [Thiobacillus sp.]
MNARQLGLFGLAALGLALTAPVHAAPDFMESAFIVAQRDRGERDDARRQDRRETRQDDRRDSRRDAGREESRGYGYGYERRQQQRHEDEDRQRGRR